jgi:protein involved in polysaccharide export with SLBB domain|tara:strand:+ start:28322 stop:30055 length:1734 start_codon:yes stop_codon:yes gene_type:complete
VKNYLNTINKSFFKIFLLFGIMLFATNPVSGQNQSNNQSATGLNLNFDIFDGTYYSDPLGIQLAARQLPYDEMIDKSTYKLGVNDLLSIRVEASKNFFIRGVMVNPAGDVIIPSIGPINVDGLTITEAENKIAKESEEFVKNASVVITLESPRPIYIQVTGGVPYPGKYMIPSQSRVDQAIYSSVTDGSRDLRNASLSNSSDFLTKGNYAYRNIRIEREDGTVDYADLVSYFRLGNPEFNPMVNDGDVIILKKTNIETPKVSISGAVKADYEFQYIKGDTPKRLLEIGGGFEVIADTSFLMVFRRTDSGAEKITVQPEDWNTFKLQPNDRVVAPFSDERNTSASAWVYGEVEIPGNFPVYSGETTALELLELSGGLTDNALPQAAYLMRSGGFRNEIPNKFNSQLMSRTSDQLVQGLEYLEAETKLSQDKVFIDLKDDSQLSGLKIFDGDRLYIPRDENTLFVFGQVNNPGYFPYTPNSKVMDYVSRAGGFALSADKERVFVIKSGNATWYKPGETEIESGDRIFVDRQPVEELNALRAYKVQQAQLRNTRTQLIMTAITTITGIITTYVAIQNIRN